MKVFVSYTSSDREWAHWIGWQLKNAGHEPFVHEWEIGAGQNIPRWMEDRLEEANRLVGVFSDTYCKALYSQSERWAAYWQDPGGCTGFLVPIEVSKVTKWPVFVEPLRRLSLIDLDEADGLKRLLAFLEPPSAPSEKPAFPGGAPTASIAKFTEGGEPLGTDQPNFPAPPSIATESADVVPPIALRVPDPNIDIWCIDDREPKPQIFGRDDEIETVVGALLQGKITLVAGGPGMGKTTVATAALYDPRVIACFGRRRIFVSLEAATEPHSILSKLVEGLGLFPSGDEISLLRILETNADEQALAFVLDNVETVFDADRIASERLLKLVAQIKGLSLAVTIRGVAPPIPGAVQIDDLPKLDADAAREAFLAISGVLFKDDPNLQHLLIALDGHALSIRLVAAQAIGLPSLRGLRESWDEAHAEILRSSGQKEGRLTSVRASLALSLDSRRMKQTPLARRLVALLAFLPTGLAEDDVRSLIGERGAVTKTRINEAITCVHQLRLVERRPDSRLRIITPLRECVKMDVPVLEIDRRNMIEHFSRLAAKAEFAGRKRWHEVQMEVEPEIDNLDSVCTWAIVTNSSYSRIADAVSGISQLHRHSGKGSVECLRAVISQSNHKPVTRLTAKCHWGLGMAAEFRGDFQSAHSHFQLALESYQSLKDDTGKADSIRGLASVAHSRYDFEVALARYHEALGIYRRTNNMLGEANCINGIASIELHRSIQKEAEARSEEALHLFRKVGDTLGEASSIMKLAYIAHERLDAEVSRAHAFEALELNRSIGSAVGEAGCLRALAEIARLCSDEFTARAYIKEVLALSRRFGDIGNEADCAECHGDLAYSRSDYDGARPFFENALALYRRQGNLGGEAQVLIKLGRLMQVGVNRAFGTKNIDSGFALYFKIADPADRALPGWRAIHSALVSDNPRDSQMHREIARSSWTGIGRLDLVRDWVDPLL